MLQNEKKTEKKNGKTFIGMFRVNSRKKVNLFKNRLGEGDEQDDGYKAIGHAHSKNEKK